MAEDDLDDEVEEKAEGEGEEGGAKPRSRRTLLIVIASAVLFVLVSVAGAYFAGFLDPVIAMITGSEDAAPAEGEGATVEAGAAVFYDLPEMIVNLNTGGRKSTFLKIRVSLELAKAGDVGHIESVMPRVMDSFQVFLRELRVEDLSGSAGVYRLREELLTRVSTAVAPVVVNDVLFREMLVQ